MSPEAFCGRVETFQTDVMNIIMKNIELKTVSTMEEFLKGNASIDFEIGSREERYTCIRDALIHTKYKTLARNEKSIVKAFLAKVTGYEERQLKRLIRQWKRKGLRYAKRKAVGASVRIYTAEDIALLITTDILHKTPNGLSTKSILMRELSVFGLTQYGSIAHISVSHIYNIRKNNQQYLTSATIKYSKTNPVNTNIGERRKPLPYGKPGFIRVDSVHQGDLDGEKGVYHINLVDEILQWELVGCVPQITDEYMEPLLKKLLDVFPFVIINFHSDNGGEYVNHTVAEILERLRIKQTKSRSRKSTDNALVEGKNGSVIRKHRGRNFIAKDHASAIDTFYTDYFNIYLNYHRVCLYATDYTDKRGKIRKKYDQAFVPYERLKALRDAEQYLKKGMTFAKLDAIAYKESDNKFAEMMHTAKSKLEKIIKKSLSIEKEV
jgi:hypothetical protein